MEAQIEHRACPCPRCWSRTDRDARNIDLLLQTFDDLYASEDLQELLRTIVDRTILLAEADRGALLFAGRAGSWRSASRAMRPARTCRPTRL